MVVHFQDGNLPFMANTYLQSKYAFTSSVFVTCCIPVEASTFTFSSRINVAQSGPLVIYLNKYLIDLERLHHSTFICA
jgi:hypothetical protein